MKRNNFKLFFSILGGLVLLFIIAPMVSMFINGSGIAFTTTIHDKEVISSIRLTIIVSLCTTAFFSILAVPFAYILARYKFPLKNLVLAIIDLPIVIPHTAAGIAILGFISRNTVPGKIASFFGIDFIGNPAGIGLAMAFVSVPFLLNAARDGFSSVPERLEKAALSLGASPFTVFRTISLPLAWRSVITGFVMMFARGMSEFGAVVIIAYHPMVTPVLIFERFGAFGLKYAQPVAVLFVLVSLTFFILLRIISNKNSNA